MAEVAVTMTGIAVAVGSLSCIAAPALTPEDSAMLRSLARAAANGPFVVLIDDGDEALGAYREPIGLAAMLGARNADADADAGADAVVEVCAASEPPVNRRSHEHAPSARGDEVESATSPGRASSRPASRSAARYRSFASSGS